MRIGILTGGGDCPGLNAAIRAVVKRGTSEHGCSIIGFRNGWRGVIDGDAHPLTRDDVSGILVVGGTMLGTARCHPHKVDGGMEGVQETVANEKLDGLICIGGDGTLKAAGKVSKATGVPVIGIPKTIDNDVVGTDASIGFDTAVSVATEAIDRLHSTAESHNRVMVVELMGRHSGWIAVTAGMAGGADIILAPEEPFDIEIIAKKIRHRHRYKNFSIVAVAEGAIPAEGSQWNGNPTIDDRGQSDRRLDRPRGHQGDRGAHRLPHAADGPWVHAARGHSDCGGPSAGHAVRHRRDRCDRGGGVRQVHGATGRECGLGGLLHHDGQDQMGSQGTT